MSDDHTALHEALRRHAARPTRTGGPWWVYVVCIGGANLVRQLLLPDDVETWVQVSTFALTVIVVGGAVAAAARLLGHPRPPA
jgi:hypothetical protein